jgi:hypothetical protein
MRVWRRSRSKFESEGRRSSRRAGIPPYVSLAVKNGFGFPNTFPMTRTTLQMPATLLLFLVQLTGAEEAKTRRVVVRVPANDLAGREQDEMPVELRVDERVLAAGRRLDPSTLRIVRWDLAAGRATSQPLALRWYDNAVPYDFPECEQNVHATDGVNLEFVTHPRWGEFYNLLGEGSGGRLVWLHRQEQDKPSDYLIEFDVLPPRVLPRQVAPRGLVGDGSHRCAPIGSSTTGLIHSRMSVADFNGDGLSDLIVGCARGQIVVYPNVGTRRQPEFAFARLLMTADGRPLDVGWSAAPLVVDWDGDGTNDLLAGAERNRVLLFRNAGSNVAPRFINRGFVGLNGAPLALPIEPVPKSPPGVYPLDYYPVLEAVDFNGDGRLDLLAGGYITGRIYFCQNEGTDADGTPHLTFRGPLVADGRPLNVGDWAAAPCAADFDNDGDLDLISGNMPLSAGGGDAASAKHFLRYYENVGTRTEYRLAERPFPRSGTFPTAALATPRAADFNSDGLLDLAVSAGDNIYLYSNEGRQHAPRFAVHGQALRGAWSSAPLPTFSIQFVDWDGDGNDDLLSGMTVYIRHGDNDYRPEPLLHGQTIDHASHRGDDWIFTQLADLDRDGRLDLLFGSYEGEIWLHANLGGAPAQFDAGGRRLHFADGHPIRVGPPADAGVDFDVLQGARTAFACADFDSDGFLDMVVGDTYGKVRYFRNDGSRGCFLSGREIGDLKIRMVPAAADWDGDGHVDVIGSAASGEVVFYRNSGGGDFASAVPIRVPPVPYSPTIAVTDFNGDGDSDLVVGTAYGYFCFFERSFLEGGYAIAETLKDQAKEP